MCKMHNQTIPIKSTKKAQVEDWLPTVLFLVFILFLGLFLLLPSAANKNEAQLKLQSTRLDSQKLLIDYLRAPIDINGQKISMAEAMGSYFLNRDESIMKRIREDTESLFSSAKSQSGLPFLTLELYSQNRKVAVYPSNEGRDFDKNQLVTATIPSQNSDPIEIKLFYLSYS